MTARQFTLDETRLPELAENYPVTDDHSAMLALETAILGNGEHEPPLITGPYDLGVDLLADGDGEINGYRLIITTSAATDEPYLSSPIQRVSYFTPLAKPAGDGGLYDTAEIVRSSVRTANGLLTWSGFPRPDAAGEPEPWPIANAIAALTEVRDRGTSGDPQRAETIRLSMNYAIQVVKSINTIREPQPPDPAQAARKAVRVFAGELGDAFENLGRAMRDIADGYIPEGADR